MRAASQALRGGWRDRTARRRDLAHDLIEQLALVISVLGGQRLLRPRSLLRRDSRGFALGSLDSLGFLLLPKPAVCTPQLLS